MRLAWGNRGGATDEFETVALPHLDMLYRSTLRLLNRLRRAGREASEGDSAAWESAAESATLAPGRETPEEEFFQTVLHGDVDRALKALPLVFREAVMLTDLEGLTYKETSEALGCPIGTVMSRLSRGRSLLRHALQRYAQEHGYLRGSR